MPCSTIDSAADVKFGRTTGALLTIQPIPGAFGPSSSHRRRRREREHRNTPPEYPHSNAVSYRLKTPPDDRQLRRLVDGIDTKLKRASSISVFITEALRLQ